MYNKYIIFLFLSFGTLFSNLLIVHAWIDETQFSNKWKSYDFTASWGLIKSWSQIRSGLITELSDPYIADNKDILYIARVSSWWTMWDVIIRNGEVISKTYFSINSLKIWHGNQISFIVRDYPLQEYYVVHNWTEWPRFPIAKYCQNKYQRCIESLYISPDGEHILYQVWEDALIYYRIIIDGNEIGKYRGGIIQGNPEFSPDSKGVSFIAYEKTYFDKFKSIFYYDTKSKYKIFYSFSWSIKKEKLNSEGLVMETSILDNNVFLTAFMLILLWVSIIIILTASKKIKTIFWLIIKTIFFIISVPTIWRATSSIIGWYMPLLVTFWIFLSIVTVLYRELFIPHNKNALIRVILWTILTYGFLLVTYTEIL